MRISDWSSDVCSSDLADDQDEGDGEPQLAAEIGNEGPGQILDHADGEAADDGAAGTVQPADDGAGEAVEDDAEHHVGLEEDDGRDHHAADGTDRRCHAPAASPHPDRKSTRLNYS